jgi:HD-GYP domain-containing protein (c-di-GMP phosphodiesterase class II)
MSFGTALAFTTKSLDRDRCEIATAMAEYIPVAQRTLLVELVANAFIDGYASGCRDGTHEELVRWVDRMCDAHVDSPEILSFFNEACELLDGYLAPRGYAMAYRAPLRALERPIRKVLAKPRHSSRPVQEQLNEIDAAINAMLVRLEGADPLTAEHSRAVAAWCSRLARRLTLSEEEITFVSRCGMIHDVGKVTTPKEILRAPRKLTDEEWVFMRSHTTAGEKIVLEDPALVPFAPIVRSHHERLDGKGYPDKLTAEALPLHTRIVTVADCFNAMIGRRPYRPPMAPGRALEQLDANIGTQFDADVVAAMHEIVSKD